MSWRRFSASREPQTYSRNSAPGNLGAYVSRSFHDGFRTSRQADGNGRAWNWDRAGTRGLDWNRYAQSRYNGGEHHGEHHGDDHDRYYGRYYNHGFGHGYPYYRYPYGSYAYYPYNGLYSSLYGYPYAYGYSPYVYPDYYSYGYPAYDAYSYPYYDLYGYDTYGLPNSSYYSQPSYVYSQNNYYSAPEGYDGAAGAVAPVEPAPAADGPTYYGQAITAFQNGQYQDALRLAEHAAVEMPNEPQPHQLMVQVLLALGNYRQGAVEAHVALETNRERTIDWATLYGFYGNVDPYTSQLRALEKYVLDNPNAADAHFLVGYEYMILGYHDNAGEELRQAIRLTPQDELARHMLQQLGMDFAQDSGNPPVPEGGLER